jgi:predicted Rossmann fold flavoprotein
MSTTHNANHQQQPSEIYDAIVLGAGAAGMFCAAQAGARGLRVLLLESGERAGRKILISGGGRCNFTNLRTTPANYLSENPHFAKSALARYTPQDFIKLVERYEIPYHEKTLGQLFCDGSAQAMVSLLESECRAANVETRLRTPVIGVFRDRDGFCVSTPGGELIAKSVVVATGGLSIPKMGANGIGYDIARSFGLRIVEPRAGLVPFTFSDEAWERWGDLSGLSAEVVVTTQPRKRTRMQPPVFREKMLVTHRGLSGPVVLQVSSYWQQGEEVQFDLAPGADVFTPMTSATARRDEVTAIDLLRQHLPARMAERWLIENAPPDWKNTSLAKLEERLHAWSVTPAGTEGYAKAEVTAGGVNTNDLDSTTMQARNVPGLAFIGEVVDVTGWLGGYNFQWAWASAFAAAAAL